MKFLDSIMCILIESTNKDTLTSSFQNYIPLNSFRCLIAIAKTCTTLNRTRERVQHVYIFAYMSLMPEGYHSVHYNFSESSFYSHAFHLSTTNLLYCFVGFLLRLGLTGL